LLRILRDRSFLAALVLMGLIFLASMQMPVEFALWAFYLAPIFLVYTWGRPGSLYPTISVVSVLVLASVLPSWGDPVLPVVLLNRIFGVIAFWILGYFLYRQKCAREQSEQTVRASEERLRYALEAVSDGAWDWNIQTGKLVYSVGWLRKLGYAPEDAPAHISFWENLVHPDDMPRVQQAMADHFAGRTPLYECENRLRTKSGEYRYNLDRGRVVEWDAEGRPLRMVGADTDISERMQREAALARLAAIVESSEDAIIGNDLCGAITSWNRGATQLYGYTTGEAIGQQAALLVGPEQQDAMVEMLRRVQEGQLLRHYETQHVDRSGRVMDVSLTVSPVFTVAAHGQERMIAGTSIIARDVTQQKALERSVRQLNAELEERVQARTAELETALAELRRADQLKEAFLAAISHELRTPLTGVLGVAEALELQVSGPLNGRQLEHVRLLRRSGTRLLEMINSILHYINLLAGEARMKQQLCRLAEIGAASVRKVEAQAQLKLVTVEYTVDPPDLVLEADSEALTQLLYNLLDNAVKFTPAGGAVGLQIGRRAGLDAAPDVVEVSVWDTGIGIADGEREWIFEAFAQADSGLARRYEGIGLGLAYARRMVALMGGEVRVVSLVGQGSRFIVTLPAPTVQGTIVSPPEPAVS
jgi:two-component system, sensor histidine kinase and response regulator